MKRLLLTSCVLGMLPLNAWAQEAQQPEGQDGTLADIIVTAQRRPEPLQKTAIAVDVVSSEAVLSGGVTRATDLTALVPSLQGTGNGGATSFYIRGVGAFTANAYTDPGVAFNYDGIYIARPAATAGVFYDIERVEVLKGPQGTLYGRNATGGAINVLPAKPQLGKVSGYVNASYGNYDALNLQGAINLPLSDTTAVRVSGNFVRRDGYMDYGTDDDRGEGVRGQFLFEPSSDFSIRLAADYYHAGGNGGGSSFTANSAYNPAMASYIITQSGLGTNVDVHDPRSTAFLASTFSGISGRTLLPLPGASQQDNTSWGVNAELNWTSDLGTLTVTPAYRDFSQKVTEASGGFTTISDQRFHQTTLEARFASNPDKPITWLLGGYFFQEKVDAPGFRVLMQVLDSFQTFKQKTTSYAGFGRLTWGLTDSLRLVGGIRYTHDKRAFNGTADVFVDVCTAPTHACSGAPLLPYATSVADTVAQLGLISVTPNNSVYIQPGRPNAAATIFARGITSLDLSRTDSKITYHGGIEWDAGPSSLVYASYDTGFRSGGFAFSTFKPSFGPESIAAWTVGSKNRFLNNRLQLNVELFLWKYKDQQVAHLGPDPALGSTFYTENIGRSTNKGFEVELQYQPDRDLHFFVDLQYLKAKFNSFVYQIPAVSNGNATPPPLTGCSVTAPANFVAGANYTVNCSGQTAFRSPTWTINFGAEKTFRLDWGLITANVNTRHQTKNLTGFEFVQQQVQPAYWMTNASLSFSPESKAWSITAFVNNIENKRRTNLSYYNDPTSSFTAVYTAPRTYGARVNYSF